MFRTDGLPGTDYRYYPNTAEGRKAVSSHTVTASPPP